MAETPLHRHLTQALLNRMAHEHVRVTHAVGVDRLPDPYAIGRHEPDVIAWHGRVRYVGEAKRGPELFDDHTLEQLRDFTVSRTAAGRPSRLVLCVPARFRQDAYDAVRAAGGNVSNVSVISPPRVRVRRRPAATPLQRGRVAPPAPLGVPLQRGRERAVAPAVLALAQQAARRTLRGR